MTTSDTLLVHLLTPLLARFCGQCPDVRLDIVLGNQALNLSKRDADVAIRATDNPPETLVGRRVARIAWALYGRAADFPQAGPSSCRLERRPWVAPGDDLATPEGGAVRARARPARAPRLQDQYRARAWPRPWRPGIGVGHLPCFVADMRPSLVRLAPPEPGFAADLWLLTHPDLRHSARVRVFLDFLAAEIAERRGLIEGRAARSRRSAKQGPAAWPWTNWQAWATAASAAPSCWADP